VVLSRQSIPLHPERIRRGATLLTPAFRPAHSLPRCFVASLHTCLLSPRWSPVALPWETPSISFPLRPLHDFSHHNEGGTPIAINLSRSSIGRRRPFSLTPVFPAHPKIAPITPLQSALPKLLGLKSFRIRTYEKNRGMGLIVNQIPDQRICPACPRAKSRGATEGGRRISLHMRRSTSSRFTLLAQSDACAGNLEGSAHGERSGLCCIYLALGRIVTGIEPRGAPHPGGYCPMLKVSG